MAEDDAKSEIKTKTDTVPEDVSEDASVEASSTETDTASDAEPRGAGDQAPDEKPEIETDTTSGETLAVRSKPKAKAKSKPKPRTRTRKKTATAPEVEAESVPEVISEAEADRSAAAPSEIEPDAVPEVEADSAPEVESEARTERSAAASPEVASDAAPAPEAKMDRVPEGRSEARAERPAAASPEVAPDVAPEVEADSVREVRSEARIDRPAAASPGDAPDAAPRAVADSGPEVKPRARSDTPLAAALAVAPGAKPKPKARPGAKSNRKVALVTGASGGIGEAFARKLAADGYALVLVARSDGELNRVAGLVTAKHDLPVATVPIDLTSPGAADEVQMEFERRNITPEIVVNNAGFGLNGPVADLDHNRQIEMIDLNIRTLTDLSLRFLPEMRVRGRGGIINIASTAAYMPGPFMAVYYASKAYVLSFSEALATELKGSGITVTTVCPGPTATGFQSEAGMEKAALVKLFPMMSAEEVADIGYEGFRSGKRVVIPGVMNRIIAATTPMIPNGIILPLVRMLQGPRS